MHLQDEREFSCLTGSRDYLTYEWICGEAGSRLLPLTGSRENIIKDALLSSAMSSKAEGSFLVSPGPEITLLMIGFVEKLEAAFSLTPDPGITSEKMTFSRWR